MMTGPHIVHKETYCGLEFLEVCEIPKKILYAYPKSCSVLVCPF